MLLEAYILV